MDVSDSDSTDYDSDDDPTFDLLEEETRSTLSKLSIKKHNSSKDMSARRNVSKALEESVEEEQDEDKTDPKLGEKDQRSYETIQKTIKAGQIEKLKVEQCKIYLRKHALRLTGSKDTLIQRIKEHTDILDGRGEEKYPLSSFVLNCKGDACTGDVVMFEQNVYEMFSIASRSATGPPCGTRIVAGRIVKESYGAKKQQHTFTVEVLWSKGEKPLPPLHPLLIKGRNLYRLKTLRQKWDDEAERQKILSEKHARGSVARSNRETRVQEKEMRKLQRENRVSTGYKEKKSVAESKGRMPHQHQMNIAHSKGKQLHSLSMNSVNKKDQPQVEVVDNSQKDEQKECRKFTNVIQENVFPNQRQPLTNANLNDPSSYRERQQGFGESYTSNPSKIPLRVYNSNMHMPLWRSSSYGGNTNNYNSLSRMHDSNAHNIPTYSDGGYNNCNTSRSPLREHGHMYMYGHSQNMNWQARNGWCNAGAAKRPFQGQCEEQKKPCRFYAQGRCYYGHSCKYLHDSVEI
ncbi:zinc finger CCCH domain-containing protein 62 [Capsicum galapagoense]